jgi:hypothetical protein
VSTHLINDIIPHFGLPQTLQSDNGPAFISKVTQIVSSTLEVAWNLHIPYHPQSLGIVERINGIIKNHLKKLSIELHLPWTQLLALALDCIRATPRSPSFLSPFEIINGHPFLLGNLLATDSAPLADYLPYLNLLRKLLTEHADQILPHSSEGPITTSVKTGDLVSPKGSSILSIGTSVDWTSSGCPHNTHCCQAQWDPPVAAPLNKEILDKEDKTLSTNFKLFCYSKG